MHNFSAEQKWRELKFCKRVRFPRESLKAEFCPNRPSGCRATKISADFWTYLYYFKPGNGGAGVWCMGRGSLWRLHALILVSLGTYHKKAVSLMSKCHYYSTLTLDT